MKANSHAAIHKQERTDNIRFPLVRSLRTAPVMRLRVTQAIRRGDLDELLGPVLDWLLEIEENGWKAAEFIKEK